MQTYRRSTAIDWLDSTRLIDLRFLNQNGIFYDVFWVPTVIVKDLRAVACLASWQLVCQCIFVGLMRLVPLFCNITVVIFSPLNGMEKKKKKSENHFLPHHHCFRCQHMVHNHSQHDHTNRDTVTPRKHYLCNNKDNISL